MAFSCLDIFQSSAVYPIMFNLIGILKKFVKGLDLLLFGREQNIEVSAIIPRIYVNNHPGGVMRVSWVITEGEV